jgi:predicted amidophosphoribosyltransferase
LKICPNCLSEYRDEIGSCAECQIELLPESDPRISRAREAERLSATLRFVPAAVAEDPFDAEAYVAAVDEAGIPVLSRSRRSNAVDMLVTPGARSFWEIVVPEDKLEKARTAIAQRQRELAEEESAAARAAEEEEAATEGFEVVAESEDEALASRWVEQLKQAGITAQMRVLSDVEADSVDQRDPERTLVLVPTEQVAKARDLLRTQLGKA